MLLDPAFFFVRNLKPVAEVAGTDRRERKKQADLARFYEEHGGTEKWSLEHNRNTEVKNGSLNKKRAD